MDSLIITSITAILLTVIYLAQTFSVIAMRRKHGIVLGDGEIRKMQKRMRGHGNSAEQMPLFLILIALAEFQGANIWSIGTTSALFVLGRMAHGFYFLDTGAHHKFRMVGMAMTLFGQIFAAIILAATIL